MIVRIAWALATLVLFGFLSMESVIYGWAMGATVIAFALLPDLALIGAFDPQRPGHLLERRVPVYNLVHRPWIGLGLFAIGLALPLPALGAIDDAGKLIAAAGLAWLGHICCDRAFGYGLRESDGSIRPVGESRAPSACRP